MYEEELISLEENVAIDERHFDVLYNGGCSESDDVMDFVVRTEGCRYDN